MRRIAIFGGSFDPVHKGHLKIIEAVQQQVRPDQFLLVPCGNPPHRDPLIASPEQRSEMLSLALEGLPFVQLDERELNRQGPSYSYLTIAELRQENPDALLLFVVGWDSLVSLPSWRNWQEILANVCLLVVGRSGDTGQLPIEIDAEVEKLPDAEPASGRIIQMDFEEVAVSSTQARAALVEGRSVESYLDPSVCRYIEENKIYSAV